MSEVQTAVGGGETLISSDFELPPLPDDSDGASLQDDSETIENSHVTHDASALMDKEMKRKLMDIESSFFPDETAADALVRPSGADDTYLFGGSPGHTSGLKDGLKPVPEESEGSSGLQNLEPSSPATPAEAYRTPAPHRESTPNELDDSITTTENFSSSPLAAASKRTLSKGSLKNTLSTKGLASADELGEEPITKSVKIKSPDSIRPKSSTSTIKGDELAPVDTVEADQDGHANTTANDASASADSEQSPNPAPATLSTRPSYLQSRQASQRSSQSSTARSDISGDLDSNATLGADYALQSGGAVPAVTSRSSMALSRLPSLGSIASSMSTFSESRPSYDRSRSVSTANLPKTQQGENNLRPLDEEKSATFSPPATPRPKNSNVAPTDTVIAQHVKNIQVPDTAAKKYREAHSRSPEKRSSLTTPFSSRKNHNLTLKEQNSKIDKLTKENFDLKLKIYYLDEALTSRSEEGVKEMIAKNVQLHTDFASEKKENMNLRRRIRELERKLKTQEDGAAATPQAGSDDEKSDHSERFAEMEEEMIYLREQLHSTETHVERLQQENLAKEVEKRRMAEYIKAMGERGSSDPATGVEEAMEMWKDLLEAETARREQADEDAAKLREELHRLKADMSASNSATGHSRSIFQLSRKQQITLSTRSQAGSEATNDQVTGSTASTLVEQLRHENAELRRDLGAQTSMLTSRNRERERLQQEIEDLKITARRADGNRSVAGDSIFERSISRAHQRPVSRASAATRLTQMSDAEREEYESKQASLRDEIAQTKILNQDLERELNAHLDILTQTETEFRALKEENERTIEDLQALQAERDEALEAFEAKEVEFEQLKAEAIDAIDKLEREIEQKEQEFEQLANDLENRNEDFESLQQEMKNVSASLIQLEDDRLASQQKVQRLEQELEDANRELDAMDKKLGETATKNERLEVQLESTQGEVSFLREEQEGDKIKIGDLEAALNNAQLNLQEEKDRLRESEERLTEERRQREIIDSQEKEEVQKVLNDLNMQATKARDEVRRLRKGLSSKEVEATTWKQRLDDLESALREALGNLDGTKSSLLKDVQQLQRDLDSTIQELETTKTHLAEKDRLLRNRDALLESTGLESRRLSDMLDKERLARKQDRIQFDQAQRNQLSVNRSMQQHETRVSELETLRSQERRKLVHLEQQYKDQLLDRNNLLLALWNRLSTLCGVDWAQKNSLISGELPSLDVISRNLPGFNKNMILALKTVESIVGNFRARVRSIEKDLMKDYQTLEHTLDVRMKRFDTLERQVNSVYTNLPGSRRSGVAASAAAVAHHESAELARLKSENKLLKAEVQFQRQTQIPTPARDAARASIGATLLRHHSTGAVEALQAATAQQSQQNAASQPLSPAQIQPSDQRWIHRLKELERRLKAEREARLLDRSGARQRLEQGRAENEELRMLLERERERNALGGDGEDAE